MEDHLRAIAFVSRKFFAARAACIRFLFAGVFLLFRVCVEPGRAALPSDSCSFATEGGGQEQRIPRQRHSIDRR